MTVIATQPAVNAFSAEVRLMLTIGEQKFELAEIGPTEVVLRHAQPIPLGLAQITMTIDGRPQVWQVRLESQGDDQRSIRVREHCD